MTGSSIEDGGLAPVKRVWYRSPVTAAFILGVCNFGAPGLWGAMNSLGAGGQQTPFLVNAANALTFCLMVLTAFLASWVTNKVGVKFALFLGGAGFVPYCAGLYCNTVYGTRWFVLFGAATCGLSAGLFWAIEAAVAISYPEPSRMGKCIGIWLSFRVAGQIVGGAINLGINAHNDHAGAIDPKVYIIFIALCTAGCFCGFLLPSPDKVQRLDGRPVQLYSNTSLWTEIRETGQLFFTKKFLLIVPLIAQAVFPESFTNTYMALHFTVRARSLGSFVAAWACILVGNLLGYFLDRKYISLKAKARYGFALILGLQGGWWIWATVLQTNFPTTDAIDWTSPYFGRTFALYVLLGASFQLNYMYLYFVVENLVEQPKDIVRLAGLLRATESAAQAVAYGLNSVESFRLLGSSSLNFGLWGVALLPAWLVVRRIGVDYFGRGGLLDEQEDKKAVDGPQDSPSIDEKTGF